jgi:hypothetical protein
VEFLPRRHLDAEDGTTPSLGAGCGEGRRVERAVVVGSAAIARPREAARRAIRDGDMERSPHGLRQEWMWRSAVYASGESGAGDVSRA